MCFASQTVRSCLWASGEACAIPIALDGTKQLYQWLCLWITPIKELYFVVPAGQTPPKQLQKITWRIHSILDQALTGSHEVQVLSLNP